MTLSEQASNALKRNDFLAAEALYRKLLDESKPTASIYYSYVASLFGCKRDVEASSLLAQGEKLYPETLPPHDLFGEIAKHNGQFNTALDHLKIMCNARPDHVGYHIRYGDILIKLARYKEADRWFDEIKNRFPNSGPHGYHILTAYETGNPAGAVERYNHAQKVLPKNLAEACLKLVGSHISINGVQHALEWYNAPDTATEETPALSLLIGRCLKTANKIPESLTVYKRICSTYPQCSDGVIGLIDTLLDLWRIEEALNECKAAVSRFPDDWKIRMRLARLTQSKQDYAAAAQVVENKINETGDVHLYAELARARMASGNDMAAQLALKTMHESLYGQRYEHTLIDVNNMTQRRYAPTEVLLSAIHRVQSIKSENLSCGKNYCYVLAGASRAGGSYFAQMLEQNLGFGPYLPYVSDAAMFNFPKGAIFISHSPYPPSPSFFDHGDVPLYHSRQDVKRIFVYRHPIDNILSLWTSNFKVEHGEISDFIATNNTPFDEFLEQNWNDFYEYTNSLKYHNITWPILVQQMKSFIDDPAFFKVRLEDFYDKERTQNWIDLLKYMGCSEAELATLDVISVPAPRTQRYRYRSLMHIESFARWVQAIPNDLRSLITELGYSI